MSSIRSSCRVCGSQTRPLFSAKVLGKYDIQYEECAMCGFVQTETPYWLDEAYSSAFTTTDTGTLQRSLIMGRSAAAIAYFLCNRSGRFVDYAGGYGTLTRYMRDVGFDFYSTDLYAQNIIARGFDAAPGRYEMATAFECFEHFVNPAEELTKILAYSDTIFFTTQPCPDPAPAVDKWWYYAPHHGQHVALYRPRTLKILGQQFGLNYYNVRNYHLFTRKQIPSFSFSFLVLAGRFGLGHLIGLLMKSRILSDAALLETRTKEGALIP
ncbi:methyltransferase domain-containing protein [Rudanella paleaurantiibacter]|uniref:Methyltransferase domain-containing protein n=1 Tax=Rudanella paleaurantiibacter TaxID=2614655 RepID=A0A7J5U2M8_9BACT|nr:class I SAM-dependent methyltransferase [Rudanella paleaurantiibacter]KAB7732047.1 methyltransferase domain-containing protein [Rudanella paleaurantiibacter]